MKINPVNHAKGDTNRYCGPSAISIVTGMTTGEAARLLRHVSGKKSIKGTGDYHMSRALALCNIQMRHRIVKLQPAKVIRGKTEMRPTMTQWLRDTQDDRTTGRVFLVSAGHHWQVVTGRRFCCGRTKEIVSITDKKANRRARVEDVYELTPIGGRITIPRQARKPAARTCPYRRDLKALERKLGTKGRVTRDGGYSDYVMDPCPTFPKGLSTLHYDFGETLSRVEACLDDPSIYAEAIADGNEGHISF